MQNQTEFSSDEIKKIEVSTALNTLAYAISSDDTQLINKNIKEIILEEIRELNNRKIELEPERSNIDSNNKEAKKAFDKKESKFNDDMTNLSAVMAFINKNPDIGEMRLVATSGMFKGSNGNREFNSGVNTFAFYDETNKNMVIAERGTAPGEWGDNQYMVTNAFTGQDYLALQLRERFNAEFQKQGIEIKNVIETGHSKGGHKALICHIFYIAQEINKINESSKTLKDKIKAIDNLLNTFYCIAEDAPWLSNEAMEFFQKLLEPAYKNGLIHRPEIFIKQILAQNIIRVNCGNDYVSAINGQNVFGKECITKQTHNTVTGAHEIRTLWGVDENYIFSGKLAEQTNKYGTVHKAAQNLFENINNLSLKEKLNTLSFFMSTADNMINRTNQEVNGTKYYVALDESEQKKFDEAKGKGKSNFIKIAGKTILTKKGIKVASKMAFKKSKKVDVKENFNLFSEKIKNNNNLQNPLKVIQTEQTNPLQKVNQSKSSEKNKHNKKAKNR